MASKTLKFTEGEKGFTHDFNVKKEDNTDAPLGAFTGVRLVIFDEVAAVAKLDITANLTIVGSIVQWAVQVAQTDYNGNFIAVLHFTATGVLEKTFQFPTIVTKKLV